MIELEEPTKDYKDVKSRYQLKTLDETFKIEKVLHLNDVRGINQLLAQFHPMKDQQMVLYQHLNNIMYNYNFDITSY